MKTALSFCFVAGLCLLSGRVWAQSAASPITVSAAGGPMNLPPIDGFVEASKASATAPDLFSRHVGKNSQLLAAYVDPQEYQAMTTGAPLTLTNYIIIQTHADTDAGPVSDSRFAILKETLKNSANLVVRQNQSSNSLLGPDKPPRVYQDTWHAFGIVTSHNIPDVQPPQVLVTARNLIKIGGQVISMDIYQTTTSVADDKTAAQLATQATEKILAANGGG